MNQKQTTTPNFLNNRKNVLPLLTIVLFALFSVSAEAQKTKKSEKSDTLKSSTFSGLKWRSIGPAFTSGRIADFAVNPLNHSEYYVAVASGHVWKTVNNGTTFTPIFDNHKAYAMGVIEIAPTNTNIVWLGTGENNHQRALGYGNGVYKSLDGGASWKNMGLKESYQIGKIIIHPENHDIVFVAAEGSTWGPGGDRGLYKTIDGGETWERILYISENTGVNEVVMDPRNPQILYATSEQRRRTTYTKIGGGPESAVYKSTDGGATWNKVMKGLPNVHIGGMGIAISPANPDFIYLIVEAQDDKSGFFRSTNGGASWEKRSSYSASGQYYNEIICDPKDPEKVYSMDVYSKVTSDGGKTWNNVGQNARHVDDHAMWIDPNDTNHFMIGGDGGIYETFDGGKHFQFKTNLPVTQFYRVNVDDTEPFYWVYGGTQDNNSLGGPSRNIKREGVTNDEWIVTLGGDGFFQAIEPGNPNIIYSAYQYGNIFRYDKQSTERIKIKPEPGKDELSYRWNWNTPFILSPHSKTRLYIGANKLFRSDDRGDSWTTISDDLTRNEDRNQFKVMDKYWPSNAVVKDVSTSLWGTILAIEESPIKENLIYVGTDDGLVQITEDAGKTWRKISSFPGVPTYPYVSDIMASKFDENIVFVSFDNLKNNDFKPYLLKSTDKGKNWSSIVGNLPQDETIHTIAQDHINPELLFVGTEFNVFFTIDGGKVWTELSAGIPDIAMKDLVIQQRENDLVVATFGRGFYIIDDYSPLRHITNENLNTSDAMFFPVKDALLFIQTTPRYGQGSTYYSAPNPEFGAVFTYYLKNIPKTKKQERLNLEKELFKKGEKIPQPDVEELRNEEKEIVPYLIFTISDSKGNEVNRIYINPSTGINRINWNLRYPSKNPVRVRDKKFDPKSDGGSGMFVNPGVYHVSMAINHNGEITQLSEPIAFNVNYLNNRTLPTENPDELMVYQHNVAELGRTLLGTERYLEELTEKTVHIRQAIHNSAGLPKEISSTARTIHETLTDISFEIYGSSPQASWEELPPAAVPIKYRYNTIAWSHGASTSAPTKTQLEQYQIVMEVLPNILIQIQSIDNQLKELEKILDQHQAPYTPGRFPQTRN